MSGFHIILRLGAVLFCMLFLSSIALAESGKPPSAAEAAGKNELTAAEEFCPDDQSEETESQQNEADENANKPNIIRPFGEGLDKKQQSKTIGYRFSRYSGDDEYQNHDGYVEDAGPRRKRGKASSKSSSTKNSRVRRSRRG